MEIVLQKGSSEKVPQEQVQRNDIQVWYFPHHGVYLKRKKRWKQIQYCGSVPAEVDKRISTTQQRQKWTNTTRNFNINDVVVIVDDTAPRNSWPLGRVVKTLPGPKGLVRSVLFQTKTNTLQRPIDKLCLLLEAEN